MTKPLILPYKLLIWDIETRHLQANIWRPGEQVVRHGQLVPGHEQYQILTISYKWYGQAKVYTLDYKDPDMIAKFDAVIRQADVSLGKNSDNFDIKHINTQRMMQGLKPFPEWLDSVDDLQKQLKKYFAFPSQSLDYISTIMGFGGKEKMEMSDWVDIDNYKQISEFEAVISYTTSSSLINDVCKFFFKDSYRNIITKGRVALKKMTFYNQKDVLATEAILIKVLPYITLKHNTSTAKDGVSCSLCGSSKILPTQIITKGKQRYQQFDCLEHRGYAGKATVSYDKNRNKVFGKISN